MLNIVIATRNRHKFREIKDLLAIRGIKWHSLFDFPGVSAGSETGSTFDSNAIKKARVVARRTGLFALADDSGIEVDALGGMPGVKSARFSGSHGKDKANNAKLLRLIKPQSLSQRRARYRCSLALAAPSGIVAIARGYWEGRIALRTAGNRGFGYDPIFLVPRFGKTVGQLPKYVKQRLSHRAMACRRLRPALKRLVRQAGIIPSRHSA